MLPARCGPQRTNTGSPSSGSSRQTRPDQLAFTLFFFRFRRCINTGHTSTQGGPSPSPHRSPRLSIVSFASLAPDPIPLRAGALLSFAGGAVHVSSSCTLIEPFTHFPPSLSPTVSYLARVCPWPFSFLSHHLLLSLSLVTHDTSFPTSGLAILISNLLASLSLSMVSTSVSLNLHTVPARSFSLSS